MSKFLTDTRQRVGMVVFSFNFNEKLCIRNDYLWNKVNNAQDFYDLEKELEEKYKKNSSYADFNIINIIYF